MRTYQQRLDYETLELIYSADAPQQQQRLTFASAIKGMVAWLVAALTHDPDVRIWEATDKSGHTYWRVKDPVSGRSATLSSENEVRAWIEARYYR